MNFIGPARPLADADVITIAGYLGCEVAAIRAVLSVESAGKGFGPDNRPIILNESHVLWRELGPGAKRDRAARDGLAYQQWGMRPYPRTQGERYAWLAKAMAIDETAALRSCSWGLGQVMGFNHRAAGFDTVQAFVAAMTVSEGAHIYAMARFIVTNRLQQHLRSKTWDSFARGYNGAGYAANQYDRKLADAYARRPSTERVVPPPATEAQLAAMISDGDVTPPPPPDVPPPEPAPPPSPAPADQAIGVGGAGLIAAFLAAIAGLDWPAVLGLSAVGAASVGGALYLIHRSRRR